MSADSHSDAPQAALAAWLHERSDAVLAIEKQAGTALYEAKDEDAYRELMSKKAALLAAIARDASPLLERLPASDEKEYLTDTLEGFSQSAANALRIGSVFYMSALLYPDEHKPGEPNNLELLAARAGQRAR